MFIRGIHDSNSLYYYRMGVGTRLSATGVGDAVFVCSSYTSCSVLGSELEDVLTLQYLLDKLINLVVV